MNNLWLVLDCDYLCHRIKHAMGGALSFGSIPTDIVFGFLKEIVAYQEEFKTDKIIFCWDSKVSLRRELYPSYKANRRNKTMDPDEIRLEQDFRQQLRALRKDYLPEIGYRNILFQKGYESDDMIAMAAAYLTTRDASDSVMIIASDHDLYQCIRNRVSIYSPQNRSHMTLQSFYTEYGLRPLDWGRVKCIAGCSTDNVQGIRGVGELTAIKYIRNELKPTTKAHQSIQSNEGLSIIMRNEKLVVLPFEGAHIPVIVQDEPSLEGWQHVCERLGMKSLAHGFNPFPFQGKRRRIHK